MHLLNVSFNSGSQDIATNLSLEGHVALVSPTALPFIRTALWPFVNAFDLTRNRLNDPGKDLDDGKAFSVSMKADFDNDRVLSWTRQSSPSGKRLIREKGEAKAVKGTSKQLQESVRNHETQSCSLPAVAFFNLDEEAPAKAQDNTSDKSFYSRTFGYRDCLSSVESKALASEWFVWFFQCYREHQLGVIEGRPLQDKLDQSVATLRAISAAMDLVVKPITGWTSLSYSVSHSRSIIMEHEDHGTAQLTALAPNTRNLVISVLGMAHRCIKLNPQLRDKALQQCSGVFLVDTSSLPASWQAHLIKTLPLAFPGMQFIIGTR
jgi:predicted ATP-binding protein involved in virulence